MSSSDVRQCSTCFMTEEFPGVTIEDNGSCSLCNGYDLVSYAESRTTSDLDELRRVAETMKKNRTGKYDCVIGASGGLDSSYVVYVASRVLGLNPLVVHYDHGFSFEGAIENIDRMCDDLGIDLRRLRSPKRNDWKFVRHTVRALRPIGIFWSVCTFCHYVCSAVSYKVALEEDVGYIMGSANPYQKSLHLTKDFRLRRIASALRSLGPLGVIRTLFHLAAAQYYLLRVKLDFYVGPPGNLLMRFNPPESVERIDVTKYLPWNIFDMVETMERETRWRVPPDPGFPMRFDCRIEAGLLDATYKNVTGQTVHGIVSSNLIYGKLKAKGDLEKVVERYDENLERRTREVMEMLDL